MNFDKNLFLENIGRLNISVKEDQIEKLDKFAGMVIKKNKVMNLTAITDPEGFAVKHYADSISLKSVYDFREGTKVTDIGTGAGFPGMPLLITCPDIKLTMLDSTAKRLNFIKESLEELDLEAEILHARAEEAGKSEKYREQYDVAVSRAVASLNVLAEYSLPFVKVGGVFIAMKSAKADEEISAAKNALEILGGKVEEVRSFTLSDEAERNLVIIRKVKPTPPKYPRVSAQIAKKQL